MYLKHWIENRFRRLPRQEARVDLRWEGRTAHVTVGPHSFFVRSDMVEEPAEVDSDFALFGAAAIAQSHNLRLVSDLEFSSTAIEAVKTANQIVESWHVRLSYPINVETLPQRTSRSIPDEQRLPGLICLSGGVDSTYAAIRSSEAGKISHGMLISGADYPTRDDTGFQKLLPRVRKIGDALGLETFVTETSIRHRRIQWSMTHVNVLAMCMVFHKHLFQKGFIGSDFTLSQEFGYHPWGNTAPLVQALSTPDFPIRQAGNDLGRTRKVGAIAKEHPDLMAKVSVCLSGFESGRNCGVCAKCLRTRLNLSAMGVEYDGLFDSHADLASAAASIPFPKHQAKRRQLLVFMLDIQNDMPSGPVKDALDTRIETLKRGTLRTGKI